MPISAAPFSEIASAVKTWPGPAWLSDVRSAALGRFTEGGLPTTRQEGWRTTPLPDFGKRLSPGLAATEGRAKAVVEALSSANAATLVFVDGFHSVALSSVDEAWPGGVRVAPLSRLLAGKPDPLRPWFESHAPASGALHDLNTAAFRDGASIVIEDGVASPVELRILVVSTSSDVAVAQHVRNLIHVGRGSSLRLTVAVVGDADASGFVNSRTEVSLAERSRLDLVRVHESPAGVPHFDALSATIGAHAEFRDTLLQTGPSWTRSEIDVVLNGERGNADLGGVFIARGSQVSDIHTVLSHEAPGVTSRQDYRGLAADEARGVFHGQIKVDAAARGTDAIQSNKNMLLSKRAQVHSTPALEILTDDVKCKHGSATGQIDQAQLFYLRSRGLSPQDATRILTRAFAGEILSRVTVASTRALVEARIAPSLESLGAAA